MVDPGFNVRDMETPAARSALDDLKSLILGAGGVLVRPTQPAARSRDTRSALIAMYPGLVAYAISRLINGDLAPVAFEGAVADQRQQNGAYGVHQLRVRLPNDPVTYRVLVMPADAPVTVGGCPIDEHFLDPIDPSATHSETCRCEMCVEDRS